MQFVSTSTLIPVAFVPKLACSAVLYPYGKTGLAWRSPGSLASFSPLAAML